MKKSSNISNTTKMNARYLVFAFVMMCIFAILVLGLYNLQIVKGDQFAEKAGTQATKTLTIKGKRGMITDSEGVILAKSEKMYNVTFWRDSTQNKKSDYRAFTSSIIDTIKILEKHGNKLSVEMPMRRNEQTTDWEFFFGKGLSEETILARENMWRKNHYIQSLTKYPTAESCFNRLVERYFIDEFIDVKKDEALALQIMAVYSEMQMNLFNALPVEIAKDVEFTAVQEIEGRSMLLSGMDIKVSEKRIYPHSTLASQIIGYTGKIQNYETYYRDYQPAGYALNDYVGIEGIEKSQESWLTACITERQGGRVMEKDSNGRLTRQIDYTEPKDGNNVKLTINAAYQRRAEQAIQENVEWIRNEQEKRMQEGKWLETNKAKLDERDWEEYPARLADKGVLLVMDVYTGKLLAMAQYPTYDLNIMQNGGALARDIVMDERGLLMNYAIQTRAEPGSTFKMVTGLAALTNGVITPTTTITDEGPFMEYTSLKSEAPTCWLKDAAKKGRHIDQTIVEGLSNSCNYFFYTLGHLLYGDTGTDRLYKYATQMGLSSKTGIELNGELRSIVGNQNNLYDSTVSLTEQVTDTPIIVANAIKTHIRNFASSYGIVYDDERLNRCIKQLMDMALITSSDQFVPEARQIFMNELAMTREMVFQAALMRDLWNYLNTIKWGGSLEIQMAIGQSITLTTPVAEVRYVASLVEGNVWNLSIIDSITSPEGELLSQRSPQLFGTLDTAIPYLPYIKQGMKGVVDESGTAQRFFKGYNELQKQLWAKTGTSQITIGRIKIDIENNAWFACVTPFDHPELALVSYIPNGFSGGYSSLAARDWINWWMQEQNKVVTDISLTPGNQLTP